jgi:hypothetical protein
MDVCRQCGVDLNGYIDGNGLYGIFHHVSKDHLYRYCDEFNFRWNWRSVKDGERATEAIKGFVGKRLSYKGYNVNKVTK